MSNSEQNLDQITRAVLQAVGQRLGGADADVMEVVVREVVSAMSGASDVPPRSTPAPPARPAGRPKVEALVPAPGSGNRAVVTTTGPNKRGVLGLIATQIAEAGGDIQDVSQTIVAGFFTMIMVVEVERLDVPFSVFKEQLVSSSKELGIHAVVMHEKVLSALQRV